LANARQKRFYEKNKETLKQKRDLKKKECTELKTDNEQLEKQIQSLKPLEPPAELSKISITKFINEFYENVTTKKSYINNLNQLMRIIDCSGNLTTCLNNFDNVKNLMSDAKQINGEPYSLNSKIGYVRLITTLIRDLKMGIKIKGRRLVLKKDLIDKYTDLYNEYQLDAESAKKDKLLDENQAVPSWDHYMRLVEDNYGLESKEYLLFRLYREIPVRDNMQMLLTARKGEKPEKDNLLYVPRTALDGNAIFKLLGDNFKTGKRYGTNDYNISHETTEMIKTYMKKNEINYGEYLFGNKKLTKVISDVNTKLGFSTGINLIRHSIVSTVYANNPTNAEKVKLARLMTHSADTAEKSYVRPLLPNPYLEAPTQPPKKRGRRKKGD
jgi:hypothetical protein